MALRQRRALTLKLRNSKRHVCTSVQPIYWYACSLPLSSTAATAVIYSSSLQINVQTHNASIRPPSINPINPCTRWPTVRRATCAALAVLPRALLPLPCSLTSMVEHSNQNQLCFVKMLEHTAFCLYDRSSLL